MDEREAMEVLGLRARADRDDVKRAYRRLARELHPDVGGDPDRFRRVQQAYDTVAGGASVGPAPQQRRAGVDERWWESSGVWHDAPVDLDAVVTDLAVPSQRPARASTELLASMLTTSEPVAGVTLHSRSPGSRLHGIIGWLQPDLLATLSVTTADAGPRAGHDVDVTLRAPGGKGRRILADAAVPGGWTRARGSESVRIERRFRPSRTPRATGVRVAIAVRELTEEIGWPLTDWFVLS